MAETHELRLKIDAGAAKTGSRQFSAAVDAVRQAVRDLERDSTGAFTKLQKNLRDVAAAGKMKVGGVDKQSIRDLESFARAQAQIATSSVASVKQIKSLISTIRGLSDSYAMARGTSEAFAASILKTNSALMRQIQLASQARSAVRQIRTAPMAETGAVSAAPSMKGVKGETDSIARALRDLIGAYNQAAAAGKRAGTEAANAQREAAKAAREAAKAAREAAAAQAKQESVQLSASAAIRRAEIDTMRLVEKLRQMGDTRGANAMVQALLQLKATMGGATTTAAALRKAMDEYAQSTQRAKVAILSYDQSQARAAKEARVLASAQRDAATAAQRVEREMRSIAGANNAAEAAFRRATGSMRGLENAFSTSFQIGSLFRTMIGSITFGTFIQNVYQAGAALEQFAVSMEVATGSASGAMAELDYIDGLAGRLGVGLQTARDNYSKFAISASLAGVSTDKTRKIFESVSTAMSVLGKSTEDQNLAFLALEQMMSKGKVSSEELRRQLGERLPGAVNLMAKALNMSMDELQDALKAGEINSADALPKFAEEVMKAYGPGFEAATKRAGFNLGTLRNELTKMMETVARSGFMQELSYQFARLTQVMRSGEAEQAAKGISSALASMARVGGDALVWLIENIERVGEVMRAVVGGLIVRQAMLMVNALVTGVQQFAGYAASLTATSAATTAATASTTAHTTALSWNNAALMGNATASRAAGVSTALLARQQEVAVRAAMLGTSGMTAATAATTGFGAAAARTAAVAGILSRGLAVIAPIAGIAVTALLLIPGALDMIGFGAQEMADNLDDAITRSGAKFDELGDTIQKTASSARLSEILTDLNILDGRLDDIIAKNKDLRLGVTFAAGQAMGKDISVDTGFMGGAIGDFFANRKVAGLMDQAGLSAGVIDNMSKSAKKAVVDLTAMYLAAEKGEVTFLDFNSAVSKAQIANPESAAALNVFKEMSALGVQSERAVVANQKALVDLYGTADDRLVKGFAEMASKALQTGQGISELRDQMQTLSSESPQVADRVKAIYGDFTKAVSEGTDARAFDSGLLKYYGEAAQKLDELRKAQAAANEEAVASAAATKAAFDSFMSDATGEGLFNLASIDEGQAQVINDLMAAFENSDGLAVTAQHLNSVVSAIQPASESMGRLRDEALQAFNQLDKGQQTFTAWSNILDTLAAKYNDPSLSAFVERLKQAGNESGKAAMSSADLARAFEEMGLAGDATAQKVLELARQQEAQAQKAYAAGSASAAAASGMYDIQAGANAASAAVAALNAALASLGAAGVSMATKGAEIADNIRFETALKAMPVYEREAAKFVREATKAIDDEFDKAVAELPEADRSGGPLYNRIMADRDAALKAALAPTDDIAAAALANFNTKSWEEMQREATKGGGGGGGGRSDSLKSEQEALDELNKTLQERMKSLQAERLELELLASGQFETAEAAKLMAEAMVAGGGAVDGTTLAMIRQIDAAAKLNEQLKKVAEDPVKKWMDSVPNWIEAGQQIEMGAIGALKDSISEFIQTGKFDIESLGNAILGTIADIVADKAVAELMNLLGRGEEGSTGLGGILGGLFSSKGDENPMAGLGAGGEAAGIQNAMMSGSQTAGTTISTAMTQAGQTAAQAIATAMGQGGTTAGAAVQNAHVSGGTSAATSVRAAGVSHGMSVRTATTTAGSTHASTVSSAITSAGAQHASMVGAATAGAGVGGGGFLSSIGGFGGLLSMALGAFSEGGISTSPVGFASMPATAFRHAPHYKQGTPNTSGIPAVLHPNEAVIPLSKGRKIPVEMGDSAGGGTNVVQQTFHIQTPDADSFRRSQKQIAADAAAAGQRALSSNR